MKIVATHSGRRALELDIPPGLQTAPVISVQHVEKARNLANDPFDRSMEKSERPDAVDGADYRAMIVDQKQTPSGRFKYKVHFHGFPNEWLGPFRISPDLVKNWNREQKERHSKGRDILYAKELEASTTFNLESKEFPRKPLQKGKKKRPILFLSRATHAHEKNYEATELELSCIACAFTQLDQYLEGSKMVIFSDHKPIHNVLSSSPPTRYSTRIDKARMVLMPWLNNIEVKYIEERKIAHVDALSRITHVSGGSAPNGGRGTRGNGPVKARDLEIGKDGDDGPEVSRWQDREDDQEGNQAEWPDGAKEAKRVDKNVEKIKHVEGRENLEDRLEVR
jgi:hypothetical protein